MTYSQWIVINTNTTLAVSVASVSNLIQGTKLLHLALKR